MKLLITGGAGFIGSNFVRYILKKYPGYKIVVLDKLTYAGNLDNLKEFLHGDSLFLREDYETSYPHRSVDSFQIILHKVESVHQICSDNGLLFIQGDICDSPLVGRIMPGQDVVVNFAAESHVDRSIMEAGSFVTTDVYGTYVLLEAARKYKINRFIQIGSDEACGSIQRFPADVNKGYRIAPLCEGLSKGMSHGPCSDYQNPLDQIRFHSPLPPLSSSFREHWSNQLR